MPIQRPRSPSGTMALPRRMRRFPPIRNCWTRRRTKPSLPAIPSRRARPRMLKSRSKRPKTSAIGRCGRAVLLLHPGCRHVGRRVPGTVCFRGRARHRRPSEGRSFQSRHGRCCRRRALLLPHSHSHRRMEARRMRRFTATRPTHPLLLASHRVATYISAEHRRLSRRARQNRWGPTLKFCAKPGAGRGPGRSAGKRGCKWRK